MAEAAGSAEVVSVAGMEMEAGLAVGAALEAALVPPLLEALLGAPGEVMEVEVMEVEVMEAGVAVGEETVRCPTSALPSALPYLCAALCAALPSALPYLCAALPLRCPTSALPYLCAALWRGVAEAWRAPLEADPSIPGGGIPGSGIPGGGIPCCCPCCCPCGCPCCCPRWLARRGEARRASGGA
jgi:hypothetical protein